jgi:phage gp36-like protein
VYLTPERLTELFGADELLQLSQLYDPDAIEPDAERIQAAIDWADSVANSYVAVVATLPLPVVPVVLQGYVADLARYQMDQIHPREDVRRRYEDAIAWFKSLAGGKVSLGLTTENQEVDSSLLDGGEVAIISPEQVFTADALRGF